MMGYGLEKSYPGSYSDTFRYCGRLVCVLLCWLLLT